jgi:hypothetical protein
MVDRLAHASAQHAAIQWARRGAIADFMPERGLGLEDVAGSAPGTLELNLNTPSVATIRW